MKPIFLILSFSSLLMFENNFENLQKTRYVVLSYSGDELKPYPIILLHLKGSTDTILENSGLYLKKFEIQNKEFEGIKSLIFQTLLRGSKQLPEISNPYQFKIVSGKEVTVIQTPSIEIIKLIFDKIPTQILNQGIQEKLISELTSVYSRLVVE